jgi:hypothetical protein
LKKKDNPTMQSTSSAFGHFDDIEQEENLTEILELLANSGYFRAKIQGLSAFDKVNFVGN